MAFCHLKRKCHISSVIYETIVNKQPMKMKSMKLKRENYINES
jgi:hypothetical protein